MKDGSFLVKCCLWAFGVVGSAVAQSGMPIVGEGGVMKDAERRVLMPAAAPSKETKVKDIQPTNAVPRQSAEDAKVVGVIREVVFYGSTNFTATVRVGRIHLHDLLMKELGGNQPKTQGEINQALTDARQKLVGEGYYLVRLGLLKAKPYDSKTGVLAVLVDEGRFGQMKIHFKNRPNGGRWFSQRQMEHRFQNVKTNETFNYSILRQALFDVNSHPDLTVDTAIRVRKPIEGESDNRRIARYADLDLTVQESFPIHGVWEIDNYGMEEIDEWQSSMTIQYLNLTKADDVLTFSPAMSLNADLLSMAGSYMRPHDIWRGGSTTLYGGYSYLDTEDVLPRLDLEGTGYFGGLVHSQNLLDNERHLLSLNAGVLYRYIEDQYTVMNTELNERNIVVLPVSVALSYTQRQADFLNGRNFGTIQGLYNVMAAGDSDMDEMWTDAEENYWISRFQVARLQPVFGWLENQKMAHQWMLFGKIEGQYTSDVLIPAEKLIMGGYNTIRGYRTKGYLGDSGAYGTLELRTPILLDRIASLWGDRTGKSPLDRLQFLVFTDFGYYQLNDMPDAYEDSDFLWSAGPGLRAAVTEHTQLRFDVGIPLIDGENDEDDNSIEYYLTCQVQF